MSVLCLADETFPGANNQRTEMRPRPYVEIGKPRLGWCARLTLWRAHSKKGAVSHVRAHFVLPLRSLVSTLCRKTFSLSAVQCRYSRPSAIHRIVCSLVSFVPHLWMYIYIRVYIVLSVVFPSLSRSPSFRTNSPPPLLYPSFACPLTQSQHSPCSSPLSLPYPPSPADSRWRRQPIPAQPPPRRRRQRR